MMIFVSVGSQKFQFNRLLRAVDDLVGSGQVSERVFAQSGACDYHPRHFESKAFLDRDEMQACIQKSDLVITHGGTGVIIESLRCGKPVVAMPRLACYGEHVDDHQIELLDQFEPLGSVFVCRDQDHLSAAIDNALKAGGFSFSSNTDAFVRDLREYLDGIQSSDSCLSNSEQAEDKMSVCVIGPDAERSQGGMASLIGLMMHSDDLRQCFAMSAYPSFADGNMGQRVVFSLRKLARFSEKRIPADVYHIHICSGTSTWRKLRYIKKISDPSKIVLHVHGARYHRFFSACSEKQKQAIRRAFCSVGAVVVLSQEWKEFLLLNEICDPAKVRILHNAVDVPSGVLFNQANKNVLFMGRLGERKSPDVLLQAAALVLKSFPDATFTFCGDGNVKAYEKLASDLGIRESCSFPGWLSGRQRDKAFRDASIFCLPSKDEGMPMSVLEAMSYGLAAVSTPVGGIPRVITSGENGLLVPVGDVDALVNALAGLLMNDAYRKAIGVNARTTIQEEFSMEAYSGRLADLYQEVVL